MAFEVTGYTFSLQSILDCKVSQSEPGGGVCLSQQFNAYGTSPLAPTEVSRRQFWYVYYRAESPKVYVMFAMFAGIFFITQCSPSLGTN